ncbi:MAG TPA: hypothetical protein VLP43_11745 [Solirubrobacteraceae bacterium]|nr:hypothetical protein [Solirubrobacteraceae bacterium]
MSCARPTTAAEFVWAVLDCPTYFAMYMNDDLPISVLARPAARINAPIAAGEEHESDADCGG